MTRCDVSAARGAQARAVLTCRSRAVCAPKCTERLRVPQLAIEAGGARTTRDRGGRRISEGVVVQERPGWRQLLIGRREEAELLPHVCTAARRGGGGAVVRVRRRGELGVGRAPGPERHRALPRDQGAVDVAECDGHRLGQGAGLHVPRPDAEPADGHRRHGEVLGAAGPFGCCPQRTR